MDSDKSWKKFNTVSVLKIVRLSLSKVFDTIESNKRF
jgi:hypothetical protein